MATNLQTNSGKVFERDLRANIFRILAFFIILAIALIFIKRFVGNTFVLQTNHMAPKLRSGDRILVLRPPLHSVIRTIFPLRYRQTVVFRYPHKKKDPDCLHIAAIPGDTFAIHRGKGFNITQDSMVIDSIDTADVIDSLYSIRDYMPPCILPKKGDTIQLESLSFRMTLFVFDIICRENDNKNYALDIELLLDSTDYTDSAFNDFTLYQGTFDTLPIHLKKDATFWKRFRVYLRFKEFTDISLSTTITLDNMEVFRYIFRDSYYFLLGENWKESYDSRYFGPIGYRDISASVVGVLWSRQRRDSTHQAQWRFNRILKVIH